MKIKIYLLKAINPMTRMQLFFFFFLTVWNEKSEIWVRIPVRFVTFTYVQNIIGEWYESASFHPCNLNSRTDWALIVFIWKPVYCRNKQQQPIAGNQSSQSWLQCVSQMAINWLYNGLTLTVIQLDFEPWNFCKYADIMAQDQNVDGRAGLHLSYL